MVYLQSEQRWYSRAVLSYREEQDLYHWLQCPLSTLQLGKTSSARKDGNRAVHAVHFKASVSFNVSVLAYCACSHQRNTESRKGTEALATGDVWGHSDPTRVHTATSHCNTLLDHTATASLKAPPAANNTFGISNTSLVCFITVSAVLLVQ